jgi:hypothetical protein
MKEHITEVKIGNTLFIVTAKCSPTATETVEKKLERLICRHVSNSYQTRHETPLAICSNQSEHGTDTI